MTEHGLSEEERARLGVAGFSAPVTVAVSREAASMRLLFLRRQGGNTWAAILAGFAAVAAGALNAFDESFGWIITVALPFAAGLLALGPWLEIRMMRRHEPVRWAARRLAVLAVTADPEQADDEAFRALVRYAGWAARLESPRSVLRYLARRMIEEETGSDPRNPAPNRTLTVDQSQLSDTIWFGLAVLAVLAIIGLVMVRAAMGDL